MTPRWVWVAYFIGAGLTLAFKMVVYVRVAKMQGVPVKKAILEWLFEPTAANATSWVTTIGVVWVIGWMYVSDPSNLGLPKHYSIAFTLGTVIELVAPPVARKLVSAVVSAFGEKP